MTNNNAYFQVSVVVLIYNSRFEDIARTLRSILHQQNVKFQIIIGDDGSIDNHFDKIAELFNEYKFTDFKFCKHDINRGTCINCYDALCKADGEFVKPISPKDYLYDSLTLSDWYAFMKDNSLDISFGKCIYYLERDCGIQPISMNAEPNLYEFYQINKFNLHGAKVSNLVLYDCILGASFLCRRDILLLYLKEIIGRIRLCEDYSYRLMLLDGRKVIYYDRHVLYYSYRTGISTKKNSDGVHILRSDEIAFDEYLKERMHQDKFSKKLRDFTIRKNESTVRNRLLSFVYFPSALLYRIKKQIYALNGHSKTDTCVDYEFLDLINVSGYEEKEDASN